jgi:hypothetical protein
LLNGPFWTIDPEKEKKIVAKLRFFGIKAKRRDDLRFH